MNRLLMTARCRLQLSALLRGLAPGLWLAAAALIALLLLPGEPSWTTIAVTVGSLVLATMIITLFQTSTNNTQAATAADYWLGSYGLITTAADILARQPQVLTAAEQQVLQQASLRAPAWTRTLRQQTQFTPGGRWGSALATLLVAVFLLSLQSPTSLDRGSLDRGSLDRVSQDSAWPNRFASNQSSIAAASPRAGGAPMSQVPFPQASIQHMPGNANENLTASMLEVNTHTEGPASPQPSPDQQALPRLTPVTSAVSEISSAATPQSTEPNELSSNGAEISRRGTGMESSAGAENAATGVATAISLSSYAPASDAPYYEPFVTGSSGAIMRRFFARQDVSDE
ncbi:hypothetical protein EYC98_05485 [Halieaceae bacterium IMCC14734]|uniref:DUF4175 family protein n=1 Tax=Candidatus Litorirhabdus singularis TaxID=2518993 RepID=A0ABT3TDE5_9GAMM|nr:hypothetical protein [Candidatus Litorirhabdus singularis]MCX2980321.1 hypothetical protein [Candidatus Litorirhabdus singularis]